MSFCSARAHCMLHSCHLMRYGEVTMFSKSGALLTIPDAHHGPLTAKKRCAKCGQTRPLITVEVNPGSVQILFSPCLQERPIWLSPSVHVFNFALAWTDTAFASPRTFTRRAEILSTCLITVYICIILGSRHVNGGCRKGVGERSTGITI